MSQHPQQDDTSKTAEIIKNKSDRLVADNPTLYTESLMEIFEFSELDLNTNRSGLATQAQRSILLEELKEDADAMWLMLSILLATSVLIGLIMRSQGIPMEFLVISGGLMIGGMLLYAYMQQIGLRKDASRTRVLSVQGELAIGLSLNTKRQNFLSIGGQSLPLTLPQARALAEYKQRVIRVYYAEHSKTILSAEAPLDINMDKLKVDDWQADDMPQTVQDNHQRQMWLHDED